MRDLKDHLHATRMALYEFRDKIGTLAGTDAYDKFWEESNLLLNELDKLIKKEEKKEWYSRKLKKSISI